MQTQRVIAAKARSLEFLQYLEENGLKKSCNKETLRDEYYNGFRPICVLHKRDTRGASFSAVFFNWKRMRVLLASASNSTVLFNPNWKGKPTPNAANQTKKTSPKPTKSKNTTVNNNSTTTTTTSSSASSLASQLTKDDFIPLWIKVNVGQVVCKVCGLILSSKEELAQHSSSRNHRIQGLIWALKENKPFLVQNKGGIVISSQYDDNNDGSVRFEVTENRDTSFPFEIKNESEKVVTFKKYEMLKKVGVFTLTDAKNVTVGGVVHLVPGATYQVTLSTNAKNVGRYRTPLAFTFVTEDQPENHIHIIRLLNCRCKNALVDDALPTAPYIPVRKTYYTPRVEIEDGLPPKLESSSELERIIPLEQYRVPSAFRDVVKHKLNGTGLSGQSAEYLEMIKPYLTGDCTWEKYTKRFAALLHAEEIQMELDIRNYDLNNTTMVVCQHNSRLLSLKVPGLAENRPSVLKGDVLYAAKKLPDGGNEHKEYKGYVHDVGLNELYIGFSAKLREEFVNNMRFAVRFTFNRLALQLEHRSVVLADENSLEKMLFPVPRTVGTWQPIEPLNSPLKLVNRQLESNIEQRQAIEHIVRGTSRPAPYLIFGPPGTGKTVTLVEAIQQVLLNIPGAHILACAPSNSAADLIAQRLLKGKIGKSDIFRMNAVSRTYFAIPEDIKEICNYNKSTRQFWFPSKATLEKYKVIVTTMVTAGRLASANFPSGHFSHIFIDEAGHATEPEAVIALAGIIESDVETKNGGQVVLAGDPEQLGPILRSPIAVKHGLGLSLLERLMKTQEVYARSGKGENKEVYNVRIVTKLLQNYRSHPSILQLPNRLFYDNELVACADQMSREQLCTWKELPKKGFPLIFHGIAGQDSREERSPSFFNPEEVAKVVEYIDKLMEIRSPKLKMTDIGVISPYRKQVQKLQQALRKKNWNDIKVGSVEEFQGRENTVIIISTVRSNPEYLAVDAEYKLGFLANPKRFNVAVTRAKALLIVIGNPATLARDEHWKKLLDFCKINSAYTGCYYGDVEEDLEDIMERLAATKLDDVSQSLQSPSAENVGQAQDLPWRNDP